MAKMKTFRYYVQKRQMVTSSDAEDARELARWCTYRRSPSAGVEENVRSSSFLYYPIVVRHTAYEIPRVRNICRVISRNQIREERAIFAISEQTHRSNKLLCNEAILTLERIVDSTAVRRRFTLLVAKDNRSSDEICADLYSIKRMLFKFSSAEENILWDVKGVSVRTRSRIKPADDGGFGAPPSGPPSGPPRNPPRNPSSGGRRGRPPREPGPPANALPQSGPEIVPEGPTSVPPGPSVTNDLSGGVSLDGSSFDLTPWWSRLQRNQIGFGEENTEQDSRIPRSASEGSSLVFSDVDEEIELETPGFRKERFKKLGRVAGAFYIGALEERMTPEDFIKSISDGDPPIIDGLRQFARENNESFSSEEFETTRWSSEDTSCFKDGLGEVLLP